MITPWTRRIVHSDPGVQAWSFRLDAELLHQRAPLGLLGVDIGGLLLRRARQRIPASGSDARTRLLARKRRAQLGIEPIDDGAIGPARRDHAVVDHRRVAPHA